MLRTQHPRATFAVLSAWALLSACGDSAPRSAASNTATPTPISSDSVSGGTIVDPSTLSPAPEGRVELTTGCAAGRIDLTAKSQTPGRYRACLRLGASATVLIGPMPPGKWSDLQATQSSLVSLHSIGGGPAGSKAYLIETLHDGHTVLTATTGTVATDSGVPSWLWELDLTVSH